MKRVPRPVLAILALAAAARALADEKPIRIWNLTASTILDAAQRRGRIRLKPRQG